MSLATVYFIPFDIEIIKSGEPTGRYINRGSDTACGYAYTNSNPIYCLPNIEYRFDIDDGISSANIKSDTLAEGGEVNYTYKFSKQYILWDFGDGITSHEYRPVHRFNQPGSYRITVTLYDKSGIPRTNPYTFTLDVKNFLPDQIKWHTEDYSIEGMSRVGSSIPLPMTLKRSNSWQEPELYKTISVYASGSESMPGLEDQYMSNKYAHFQPTWKFLNDLSDPVPVDTIDTTSTEYRVKVNMVTSPKLELNCSDVPPVTYFELIQTDALEHLADTIVIGTTGENSLYYVDEQAKNYIPNATPPVFLFATGAKDDFVKELDSLQDRYDTYPVEVTYSPGRDIMVSTNGISTFELQETKYTGSINSLSVASITSPVTDVLVQSEEAGSTVLELRNYSDFLIGSSIVISPNTTNEEVNKITGYGIGPTGKSNSVILSKPLKNSHPASTAITTPAIGGIIAKSDYPELTLTSKDRNDPLEPFEVRIYIDDVTPYAPENLIVEYRDIGIETPGACNLTFTPLVSTSENAKLVVETCLKDPFHLPAGLPAPFMCLTNSNKPVAYMIKSTTQITGGTTYQTDAAGLTTRAQPVTETESTLSIETDFSANGFYPTCVDPARGFVYVGDYSLDRIYKLDNKGELLDTIFIPELICQTDLLTRKYPGIDNIETTLLDTFYGANDQAAATSFEEDGDPCYTYNEMVTEENSCSPSSIACDRNGNLWVTLIDGLMTLKITSLPNSEYSISAIAIPSMVDATIENLTERTSTGEFKIMPSKVDTDVDNNIYVLYTNHELQMIVKYDEIGEEQSRIYLPEGSHLTDVVCTGDGNVFVADGSSVYSGADIDDITTAGDFGVYAPCDSPESTNLRGAIYKIADPPGGSINITGIISSYQSDTGSHRLDKPTQLTCDIDSNIYFVSGSNSIIKIIPSELQTSLFATSGESYAKSSSYNSVYASGDRQAIDALGCNLNNELVIAQNASRTLNIYELVDKSTREYLETPILALSESYSDISSSITTDYIKYGYDLLQANGDWTGLRWIIKYLKAASSQRLLSGAFPIRVLETTSNEIIKINEDFDATENIVGATLQETINSNYKLLYGFFRSVIGDIDDFPETVGKTIYEKISNFTSNNKDVDVCNVKSLIGLCHEIDSSIIKYDYNYPGSVKRLLDLFSINYSHLFSTRDMSNDNLHNHGYASNFNYGRNKGQQIENPRDYTVNIGTPLVVEELYNENVQLIHPMAVAGHPSSANYSTLYDGLSSYPLSDYSRDWGWGLSYPDTGSIFAYYDFYEYIPNTNYDSTQFPEQAGVVDWSSSRTTIDESNRNVDDWVKPRGIMSSIIDKKMRYGLNLIK